jgi:hypothetical protein
MVTHSVEIEETEELREAAPQRCNRRYGWIPRMDGGSSLDRSEG